MTYNKITLGSTSKIIEIRDLRIGNILSYKGEYVHVTNLSCDIDDEYLDMVGFCKVGESTNEIFKWNRELAIDLKPIPLSKDILESIFGKDINAETDCHYTCTFKFRHNEYDLYIVFKPESWRVYFGKSCITQLINVHDLQNFMYTITGKELNIAKSFTPFIAFIPFIP